jgi:hypothetical protein
MKLDLTQHSIEELIEIKNNICDHISNYSDGFIYICKIRSYGFNWNERVNNHYKLQELCDNYNGENGIVDIYSTNPDLSSIINYGDIMYIVSENDYNEWEKYTYIENLIPIIEKDINDWNNRENLPFEDRPLFEPLYSPDDVAEYKKMLSDFDMSFVPPSRYNI